MLHSHTTLVAELQIKVPLGFPYLSFSDCSLLCNDRIVWRPSMFHNVFQFTRTFTAITIIHSQYSVCKTVSDMPTHEHISSHLQVATHSLRVMHPKWLASWQNMGHMHYDWFHNVVSHQYFVDYPQTISLHSHWLLQTWNGWLQLHSAQREMKQTDCFCNHSNISQ